jgi:glutamyl-tRNA reductase
MMAEAYGGIATDIIDIDRILNGCDAVFTCTGAQGYIIEADTLKRLANQERCPETIIDMAVPRDVDTRGLPHSVDYFDIESLRQFLDKIVEEVRVKALPEAEKIIEDEVKIFSEWHAGQSDDILGEYSEKFEQIRLQLVDELREHYSEDMIEDIDKITKKLLHRTKSTFVRILVKESKTTTNKAKIEDVPVPVSRN